MMLELVFLLLGLVGLWFGADMAVKGAIGISRYLRVGGLFIGLTVMSIGTSIPEIAVSIAGGMDRLAGLETSGLVIGNKIGSCLNQITLIMGLVGLFGLLCMTKREWRRDGAMLMASIGIFFLAGMDGFISALDGWFLIAIYMTYFLFLFKDEKLREKIRRRRTELQAAWDVLDLAGGLVVVLFASSIIIDSGMSLAGQLQTSGMLIGIFIVGLGTGLPELSVSLTAIRKKECGMSVGNLIGSNITDMLFSLGVGAVFAGFLVEPSVLYFDIPVLMLVSALMLAFFGQTYKLKRQKAAMLLLVYVFYTAIKLGMLF